MNTDKEPIVLHRCSSVSSVALKSAWLRRQFSYRAIQRVDVHRLCEVYGEASVATAAKIFLLAVSAERDAADRPTIAKLAHQVQAAAVGQADVADNQVRRLG